MQVANWEPTEILFPSPSTCFQIPVFQRPYEWSRSSAHSLIGDALREPGTGDKPRTTPHWIGVMLVGDSPFICSLADTIAGHKCRQVLDGQQRLLTLRLWMLALVDEHIRQSGESPKTFGRQEVLQTQVHGLDEADWLKLKRERYATLQTFPSSDSSPLIRNYLHFRYSILRGMEAILAIDEIEIPEQSGTGTLLEEWIAEANNPLNPQDILALLKQTMKLQITVLRHEDRDGSVEQIFETLNSKNTPLAQYDLFRNYILVKGAESQEERRDVYNSDMKASEKHLRDLDGLDLRQTRDTLDAFFQDFVSVKTRRYASSSSSARMFQDWWSEENDRDAVAFIHDDLVPSMYAWATAITAGQKHGVATSELLSRAQSGLIEVPDGALRSIWRVENMARRSFVPAIMVLLRDWAEQAPGESDFRLIEGLRAIETFVARSILAGKPSSTFRATAMAAAGVAYRAGRDGTDGLKRWLHERTPSDSEVRNVVLQSVETEDGTDLPLDKRPMKRDIALRLGNSTFCAVVDGIACQLEGEEHVKPLMLKPWERLTRRKPLQIEHLFPRTSTQWLPDLRDWNEDLGRMESRLHSLGNTTVLPHKVNVTVSNKPLKSKQTELQRDGVPKYRVSEDFFTAEKWTTREIDERTRKMCEAALGFWTL